MNPTRTLSQSLLTTALLVLMPFAAFANPNPDGTPSDPDMDSEENEKPYGGGGLTGPTDVNDPSDPDTSGPGNTEDSESEEEDDDCDRPDPSPEVPAESASESEDFTDYTSNDTGSASDQNLDETCFTVTFNLAGPGNLSRGKIRFFTHEFANPGRIALTASLPPSFTVDTTTLPHPANGDFTYDRINFVETGAERIEFIDAPANLLSQDSNAFVAVEKNAAGDEIRKTTISFVTENGEDNFRRDVEENGTITRYQQTQPIHNKLILETGRYVEEGAVEIFTPLRRQITVKNFDDPNVRKERNTLKERASSSHDFQTVFDREVWREAVMKPKSAVTLGLSGGQEDGGTGGSGGSPDDEPNKPAIPEGSAKGYITDSQGNHYRRHTPHHYWRMVREIIFDENGNEAFENNWQYYRPTDTAEPGFTQHAIGRIKSYQMYDGGQARFTYDFNRDTVYRPYAGDPEGMVTVAEWSPGSRTRTMTRRVGEVVYSRVVLQYGENQLTNTRYTSAVNQLVTKVHYLKPEDGPLFVGYPIRIENPDGTLVTYSYERTSVDGVKTIKEEGSTDGGNTVSEGIRTTTVTNSRGRTILREVQAVGFGDVHEEYLERMAVTHIDSRGRPTTTAWHPVTASEAGEIAVASGAKWTTHIAQLCCGPASITDRYGITTFYAYDSLKRRVKTNRLGVTTETLRKGLTTETHRYAESVENALSPSLLGTQATLVGLSIRNLAGTVIHSCSPDPSTPNAGALTATTTSTTYGPTGRVVTTFVGGLVDLTGVTPDITPGNHSQSVEYFLDGRTATTYGDLSPAMEYHYAVNATGELSTQAYLVGGDHYEVTGTQSDWAGRTTQTAKGTIVTNYHYFDNSADRGSRGQLEKTIDSDDVTTLHAYNAKGERTTTALNLNGHLPEQKPVIDLGTDQITFSETVPALGVGNIPVWRTVSQVSYSIGTNVLSPIVSQTDRTADGLESWSWQIGQGPPPTGPAVTFTQQGAKYTHSKTTLNDNGNWTTVTTAPDGTTQTQQYTAGLLSSLLSSVSQSSVSYEYDTLKRPWKQTDSRTGTTTTEYLSLTADFVKSVTEPGNRVTSFTYDPRGRRTHIDAPNTPNPAGGDHANITITAYNPDGTVDEVTGDQTYRVKYGYDYAQRRETMTTYGTETSITTWIYDQNTGLLDRKQYQGGNGTSYEYTPGGRLAKRTWQRGVSTEYYYDSGGRQRAIDYSGDTPDVIFTLDALGRIVTEAQGTLSFNNGIPVMGDPVRAITHTHDPATLLPESETHHLGGLTRTLVRTHDAYGRPQVVAAGIDSDNTPATLETIDHFTEFFFGNDGRLLGIHAKDLPPLNQKDYGIEYTYTAQSAHLIHTITRAGSGSAANLVTTHTWDPTRDVLFVKDNRLDGDAIPVSQFDYTVNLLGQREKVETAGTAFGEADRGWTWGYDNLGQVTGATHTANSELDRSYLFDGIGNRLESTVGDTTVVTTEYDPNPLNQYSSITVGLNNPLAPIHDLDGNLTEDATHNHADEDRQYVWDAENRLIAVNKVTARTNGVITGTSTLVTYAYDSRSRRISRSVGVSPTSTTWYLYDGWNVVAEYTGATPALARTYTWGTDLSGSLQGAGGVGGLLAVRVHGGEYPGNYYPTFDGNGNVSEYLTTTGVIAAHFEYDPFGNLTAFSEEEEEQAAEFTYRFSTKPLDPVTGWFYYGYRYYDPVTGRWLSRDPIGERGGINLYGFVRNNAIIRLDFLGMHECTKGEKKFVLGKVQITPTHRSGRPHGEVLDIGRALINNIQTLNTIMSVGSVATGAGKGIPNVAQTVAGGAEGAVIGFGSPGPNFDSANKMIDLIDESHWNLDKEDAAIRRGSMIVVNYKCCECKCRFFTRKRYWDCNDQRQSFEVDFTNNNITGVGTGASKPSNQITAGDIANAIDEARSNACK